MFNREKKAQTNIKAFLDEVKINKNWTEKYLNQNNKLTNLLLTMNSKQDY